MKLRNGKSINETFIGYKKGWDNHLIILEIPLTAKHNMGRGDIKDKRFAKHRCSEAFVKDIINLTTGESANDAYSIYKGNHFIYYKGRKVEPDMFEENIDKVCAEGIHFFLDRQRAELYDADIKNGERKEWHENGHLAVKAFYKNYKLEGEYKEWYENGHLTVKAFYKDGKLEGEYKSFHENGQPYSQTFYKDGKLEGEYKLWHSNGQLIVYALYKNDEYEGERKSWYPNGQLYCQTFYKDGKLEGDYKEWYENGQLAMHAFYNEDIPIGKSEIWDRNGRQIPQL